ncbi:hypothetical protein PR202_gb04624 [Eleusine coracana subsp. coracana]|uniref:Uncharacterized protein n=1 Tax=Eleusine coracana subsp. coracana TaxID=191504 RepID=A0AAV5E563_ELECO|nr:hypothetical protein PR202_gb04624 [Eleusine coracana subsp. coracana]
MKKQNNPGCGGGCLGAPIRALSRACDSACDLYVRGMSGAARGVPSAAAGAVGRGGRSASASSMIVRASSDRVEDLVRAAARPKQGQGQGQGRRVAPVEAADATKSAAELAVSKLVSKVVVVPERKVGAAAAAMETIAEDAPCEFGACALPPLPSRRRGAAGGGGLLVKRTAGGLGAVKVGSEVLAR